MTHSTRLLCLLAFGFSSALLADNLRVLEITGDSLKLQGNVEFLTAKDSTEVLKTVPTANKTFDWVDIPEGATAARIKVGEISTQPFDLTISGTTLAVLGLPAITQDDKGAPKAVLTNEVKTDRSQTPAGTTGWVFFGSLQPVGTGASGVRTWASLYLVLPPKRALNADMAENADTLEAVKAVAEGSRLRVDFPLILRQANEQGDIVRDETHDKTVRAGQYVKIKSFKAPDDKGHVYAEVEVLPASSPQ